MGFCPICGPKISICGIIISIWGMVMLSLMGLFLHLESPAFFEDLFSDAHKLQFSKEEVTKKYNQASLNCFIAAGAYVLVLIFSIIQQRQNVRASYVLN